jgi:hypothetical protein
MKIPSMFYVRASQAMSRARRAAKNPVRTRDFDAFDPVPFLDTAEVSGLILRDFEVMPSTDNNFHCYAFAEAMADATPDGDYQQHQQIMKQWLLWSFGEEWRFMCALAGQSHLGLLDRDPVLARSYVETAVRYWPAMHSLGLRFGPMLADAAGRGPLDGWFTLYFALGILGLSKEELRTQRSPAEFLQIVDRRGSPP